MCANAASFGGHRGANAASCGIYNKMGFRDTPVVITLARPLGYREAKAEDGVITRGEGEGEG